MDSRVVSLVLLLACSLIVSYINVVEGGRKLSRKEDMEFERQLKLLNKPAVMSIKTEYGDIYDSVDFYKQPAFDHPLLKTYTFETSPSSFPKGMKNGASSGAKSLNIGVKGGGKSNVIWRQSYSTIYTMGCEAGCYNTRCPGFVVVSIEIPVDLAFQKTSVSGGEQIEMDFFIYQDEKNGNWWLNLGKLSTPIGYWPKSIFTNLAAFGANVAWGGEVVSPPDIPSPPMGAGLVGVDDPRYAAYCRQIIVVNEAHQSVRFDDTIMYGDVPADYYDINDAGVEGGYWGTLSHVILHLQGREIGLGRVGAMGFTTTELGTKFESCSKAGPDERGSGRSMGELEAGICSGLGVCGVVSKIVPHEQAGMAVKEDNSSQRLFSLVKYPAMERLSCIQRTMSQRTTVRFHATAAVGDDSAIDLLGLMQS
ncbi:hypothetical protein HHK36_018005 [Tetracentron sinense]|uniref:Neprosin PEP catalytic domain-containing protein n=1 Tax=Tetracentron sinense TaxID=13715 RepID=A0A835DAF6_TETSI|nr:hypothetical protein HHK36_018005 [Tetracentron sinense]